MATESGNFVQSVMPLLKFNFFFILCTKKTTIEPLSSTLRSKMSEDDKKNRDSKVSQQPKNSIAKKTSTSKKDSSFTDDKSKNLPNQIKKVLESLPQNANDVFAQNVRYRTAQSLADLAEVLPDEERRALKNVEARRVVDTEMTEESLAGFVHLLRAELDARLGSFEKSRGELAAAETAKPPLPAADLLGTRLNLLLGARDYDGALKAVEAATLDPAARSAFRVRVRLAERSGTANINQRNNAETSLFKELAVVRDSARREAGAALISAARAMAEFEGPRRALQR